MPYSNSFGNTLLEAEERTISRMDNLYDLTQSSSFDRKTYLRMIDLLNKQLIVLRRKIRNFQ